MMRIYFKDELEMTNWMLKNNEHYFWDYSFKNGYFIEMEE
jgi:hypothetical protein